MTRDQQERLETAVENVWFKGLARALMIVGIPLFGWLGSRTYDAIDRIQRDLSALHSQLAVMDATTSNDRKNTITLFDSTNDRTTILSNRMTEFGHDYARVNDVLSGFTLRDQSITALDHRVSVLEGRENRSSTK